jgi:DNA polymerase
MEALKFYEALGIERLPVELPAWAPLTTLDKAGELRVVRETIGDCTRCKLCHERKNIVFGEGNPDADLMFIGEGPGKDEDLQGRPFVGEAGKLLTSLINKMGFSREDVYIGNIVKCRPPMNRDPEDDEIGTCIQFIRRQIGIIQPRVIMSLGRIALHALTGVKHPITKTRGHFLSYGSIRLMPTFHPAYLLRNPKEKFLVWDDAIKVLEVLGRSPA